MLYHICHKPLHAFFYLPYLFLYLYFHHTRFLFLFLYLHLSLVVCRMSCIVYVCLYYRFHCFFINIYIILYFCFCTYIITILYVSSYMRVFIFFPFSFSVLISSSFSLYVSICLSSLFSTCAFSSLIWINLHVCIFIIFITYIFRVHALVTIFTIITKHRCFS